MQQGAGIRARVAICVHQLYVGDRFRDDGSRFWLSAAAG
jgi:hypothetical protein